MWGSRSAAAGRPVARVALLFTTLWLGAGGPVTATRPAPLVPAAHAAPPAAPVSWEHKGFSLPDWSENGLFDSGPALEQLADTGANSVTLVITWYQANRFAADIFRTGATVSDAALVSAMQKARSLGLKIILKPQIDSQDGLWRAYIAPSDPNRWFANYGALLNHYADLGREQGAAVLSIGAELISVSANPAYDSRWRALIAELRRRFSGKLTYSANWGAGDFAEEFTRIPFWDALDYLGLSAYFELADHTSPTVDSMKARWAQWRASKIDPFQQRWGKPVLFIEGGYRSADGTARQPWNSWDVWPLDRQEQVDCYEAFFQTWANVPWFAGTAFWAWSLDTRSSPTEIWYAVQNKPAFNTVRAGFGGRSAAAGPTPTPGAPTVRIDHPESNSTYRGTIAIRAFATQARSVTYQVDAQPAAAMAFNDRSGLWEASLNTTTVPDGPHHVTITALGVNGSTVTDRAWNILIANGRPRR